MSRSTYGALWAAVLAAAIAATGCQSYDYRYTEPAYTRKIGKGTVLADFHVDAELADRILALDPDHVTEADVADTLSKAPAPHMINIHGGIYPVWHAMESFGRFLVAMGYPESRVRNPRNGDYSFSCYNSAKEIAGAAAWYYEKEGMRPMMIGHSQGGMQAIKVLHLLAGTYDNHLEVWNPLKARFEDRDWIVDPLTGERRGVVGVQLSYASAVGAGGMTRLMPNQWSVDGRLRRIPDSVAEFTGFYKNFDVLGGDSLGYGQGNEYHAVGRAKVRTVLLPFSHDHYFVPYTLHLAQHEETRDWINAYVQTERPAAAKALKVSSSNIVWAADVWTSVKRNWVIELQRLIRTKRGLPAGGDTGGAQVE